MILICQSMSRGNRTTVASMKSSLEFHAEYGPEVLRGALGMLEIGREDLEDAAVALEAAGKPSIAAIVREIAADAKAKSQPDTKTLETQHKLSTSR